MSIDILGFASQGWQCPICRRVYSPTTPMCIYCGNGEETTTTSMHINIPSGIEEIQSDYSTDD